MASPPAPVAGFWVDRGAYRICAWDHPGVGPPIVLMHGFPDDHHLYDRLLSHLVGRRVVTFDFLGWGESDKPVGYPYTAANQIGDLNAVIDGCDLDDVVLVVHDASGPPGIDWALAHPDRVVNLVLLNTYYGWMWRLRAPEAIALYSTPIVRSLARWVVRRLPRLDRRLYYWQVGRFVSNTKLRDDLLSEYYARFQPAREAFWRLNADLPRTLTRGARRAQRLRKLSCPVRVVFGADDPYLNQHVARRFADLLPQADLHLIRGARHYVQIDAPEQVAELILKAP